MARVFLAHDEALDRDVALKILWEQYADNEEFVKRFKREARSAAALNHPSVVSVYDWGCSEDEMYYIAMEYVPGGALEDRIIGEGALDPCTAAELGCQVAEALGFAHRRGVIHRDVKPQNILLTATGEIKVADFGIARAVGAMDTTQVSQTGAVLGTVGYMSPEQALGEPVGPQSDLYSLGVVLYEMLTGNLPYEADSPIALAVKHVSEPVQSPKEVNPEVPNDMNALVSGLLAKKAEDRPGSAAEVAENLRRVRYGPLPLGLGTVGAMKGVPSRRSAQATTPIPLAAGANEGKKRIKAPWLLVTAFALFALLGGSAWSLLNSPQGQDLASNQEDSQAYAPVSGPEDEGSEASEEAEQAPIMDVAPAQAPTLPTLGSTQRSTFTDESSLEQTSSSNDTLESSGFDPTPVDYATSFLPQPAPTQQEAQAQAASGQQAQAQSNSSQTSYEGESQTQKVSMTQDGQATEQAVESSRSSNKR